MNKTLLLQTSAGNQGNQNEDCWLEIFHLSIKRRKATGFMSLWVNHWKFNQVTTKSQVDFFSKTCRKSSKTEQVFYIFKIIYNHSQNIWDQLKFSCEIAHYRNSLFSVFQEVSATINKFSFWREDWLLGYHSMKFRHFPDICWFPKMLSLKLFGNSYIPCL